MTELPEGYKIYHESEVELVKHNVSDEDVARAAWVSTVGEKSREKDPSRIKGLINYLMRDRHGSPFEHGSMTFFVKTTLFVRSEHHRHRIGWCLAGDTEIWTESIAPKSGRTVRKRPISELYDLWHNGVVDSKGRVRHLASVKNQKVRTLDEKTGQFYQSGIVNIYKNGAKQLYKMTLSNGLSVRCSEDHLIYTDSGWKPLKDISTGDMVGRNGRVCTTTGRQYPPSLRAGIGVWTSMQRPSLINEKDRCYECKNYFSREELVLDHIIPVIEDIKLALDINNLAPICNTCHRKKTNSEQKLAKRPTVTAGVEFSEVVSIDKDSVEETYDLELEGPDNRGFVANGIVVHNSYNEESGRYSELKPHFYVIPDDRKIIQTGKVGHYQFESAPNELVGFVQQEQIDNYVRSYKSYKRQLDRGVSREVARDVLPLQQMTTYYATCNPRSLMAFLSLRTESEDAAFVSHPQWEIQDVAGKMENLFKGLMPLTWEAFEANRRVGP